MNSKLLMLGTLFFVITYSLIAQNFQRVYGLGGEDVGNSILYLESGYMVSGYTNSLSSIGGYLDLLLMKLDVSGTVEWAKTYETPFDDFARSTIQTKDGGFVSIGETKRNLFVVKTDMNGNLTWAKSIGGIYPERGFSILENS